MKALMMLIDLKVLPEQKGASEAKALLVKGRDADMVDEVRGTQLLF